MKKFKLEKINRRQITLIALVILIAIAGYANVTYQPDAVPASKTTDEDIVTVVSQTEPEEKSAENTEQDDYFVLSKLERDKSRADAVEVYKEVVDDMKSTQESKTEAERLITASAKATETETVLENLIKAKGFSDVVVYILNDSVTAVVKTSGLVPAQAAQIKDLIVEYTGVEVSNIKITEVK